MMAKAKTRKAPELTGEEVEPVADEDMPEPEAEPSEAQQVVGHRAKLAEMDKIRGF